MLTDRDKQILDLEGRTWPRGGFKAAAIRAELDLSETAYYAALGRLLHDPAATHYAPMTVGRVRRLQEARRALRTG